MRKIASPANHAVQLLASIVTCENFHIKILFLPAKHPELNLIKQIWRIMKREASKPNFSFKLAV